MADFVFNIAKGRAAHLATLPATNDALVAVPIEASGLEADATLKDYTTLQALLAGASNEQTTMGRKTLTSVTVAVSNTSDWVDVDAADFTWVAATGNPLGAVVICYDPDVAVGTDNDLIPLTKHDFVVTPGGADITAQVDVGGFYRAT